MRMGLLADGDDLLIEQLPGGVSSDVLKISVGTHTFCLKQALPKLKVAKDWEAPVDRIFGEIDWLKTADTIVPGSVPKIYGVDRATGCFAKLSRLAKAERQQADNASWKDLVEAERARRLSTIDADSEAIEKRVLAEEKADADAKKAQEQEVPPRP